MGKMVEKSKSMPTGDLINLAFNIGRELGRRSGVLDGGKLEMEVDSELVGFDENQMAKRRPGPTMRLLIDLRFNREVLAAPDEDG